MMPCASRRCVTFKDTRTPVAVVFENMEDGMTIDEASIEVDKHTADALQMRAAELGVTVPQLIAELATLDSDPGKRASMRSQSLIADMPGPLVLTARDIRSGSG